MNAPEKIEYRADETVDAPTQRRSNARALAIGAAVLVVAAGLGWKFLSPGQAAATVPPLAIVQIAAPLQREVTQWDDYVGRFAASKTVDVRPRVSGAVTQILFRDGDFVRKGQALFIIDPRPYRAALAEAQANVASARSSLALARADYGRVAGLTGDEAIAASEVDQLRAKVQAAAAALAGAQARVRARALDVEFATVRAPISGRISDRRVDVGNLVSGDNGTSASCSPRSTPSTRSTSPSMPPKRCSSRPSVNAPPTPAPAQVEVRLQDESAYRWNGTLDFTDNGLDPRSGTIRVRAVFANPDGFLTPGMFGNMRLADGGTVKAMLVPDDAVQSDQARKIVMTVGKDGTVTAKPVELGPLVDGLRVVRSGLAASDRVIISNYQAAMGSAKVDTRPGKIVAAAPAPAASGPDEPAAAQATLAN